MKVRSIFAIRFIAAVLLLPVYVNDNLLRYIRWADRDDSDMRGAVVDGLAVADAENMIGRVA
jgi:hypothetical protein